MRLLVVACVIVESYVVVPNPIILIRAGSVCSIVTGNLGKGVSLVGQLMPGSVKAEDRKRGVATVSNNRHLRLMRIWAVGTRRVLPQLTHQPWL
jgi:hypothetical protein